jgi:predicted alpha/beta superfamily hydrolase
MKWTCMLLCICLVAALDEEALGTGDFVLGKTERIHSAVLNEDRVLNIYLPEGYSDTLAYPVIYLLDGSADEDFIHVAGLLQYYNFPWINRVPKSILVGIANTSRGRDFTTPTNDSLSKSWVPENGGAYAFIEFIEKELQPFIQKKYKGSGQRTIIGQSLGGLLATEILMSRPGLFDKYIIISPSLWWDKGSLSQRISSSKVTARGIEVYLGVGKEGAIDAGHATMEEEAALLAKYLKNNNDPQITVHFDFMPDEDHATAGHQAIMNAFKLLYPKNP